MAWNRWSFVYVKMPTVKMCRSRFRIHETCLENTCNSRKKISSVNAVIWKYNLHSYKIRIWHMNWYRKKILIYTYSLALLGDKERILYAEHKIFGQKSLRLKIIRKKQYSPPYRPNFVRDNVIGLADLRSQ